MLREVIYLSLIMQSQYPSTYQICDLENFTLADPLLIMDTVVMDALEFDFSPYPNIVKWYKNFQTAHPDLWILAQEALNDIREYNKNPLDMSAIKHPIHPTKSN